MVKAQSEVVLFLLQAKYDGEGFKYLSSQRDFQDFFFFDKELYGAFTFV